MEIIQIQQAGEMQKVASALLDVLSAHDDEGAAVIALTGDLGAGKTTLVQAIAKMLNIKEPVTSPTYVVMKGYELDEEALPLDLQDFTKFIHIDAYRIESVDEMRVLKFPELLKEKDTIICIEWPEHIAELIPAEAIKVFIEIDGEERKVSFS